MVRVTHLSGKKEKKVECLYHTVNARRYEKRKDKGEQTTKTKHLNDKIKKSVVDLLKLPILVKKNMQSCTDFS